MKISIFVPFGIILGMFFFFLALPDYLSEEFILLIMFGILFIILAVAMKGIIRE